MTFFAPLALCALSTPTPCAAPPAALAWDGRGRVVHEWGTFTEVRGSDGVVLDGLLHEDAGLPPFVYDLLREGGWSGLSPKMETPVVYFYADAPWRPVLRAEFPRGLVTHWYPPATRINAAGDELAGGHVEWGGAGELEVLAPGAEAEPPPVAADDPWRFARQVAANPLRVSQFRFDGTRPPGPTAHDERFLFYRGLGDFPLPLAARVADVRSAAEGWSIDLALENARPDEPLRSLFLVRVEGDRAGFAELGDLSGAADLRDVRLAKRPVSEATEALVERVAARLTGTGLYADEALAMARTWRHAWFGDEGLRLLYVLPRDLVERELPLSVRTAGEDEGALPAEDVVRTFVARVELLTPAFERALLEELRAVSADPARADALAERLGRFAPPLLARARALGLDPAAYLPLASQAR